VCSALEQGVAAIFGPGSGFTAHHVQSICDSKVRIPVEDSSGVELFCFGTKNLHSSSEKQIYNGYLPELFKKCNENEKEQSGLFTKMLTTVFHEKF
jgi:hypothetical protein